MIVLEGLVKNALYASFQELLPVIYWNYYPEKWVLTTISCSVDDGRIVQFPPTVGFKEIRTVHYAGLVDTQSAISA